MTLWVNDDIIIHLMYSHTGNSIYSVSRKKRKMKTFVAPILSVFVLLSGVSGEKYLEKTQDEIININNYLTSLSGYALWSSVWR